MKVMKLKHTLKKKEIPPKLVMAQLFFRAFDRKIKINQGYFTALYQVRIHSNFPCTGNTLSDFI